MLREALAVEPRPHLIAVANKQDKPLAVSAAAFGEYYDADDATLLALQQAPWLEVSA